MKENEAQHHSTDSKPDSNHVSDAVSEENPPITTHDLHKLLGKPVTHAEIRDLTAAGDNYGSTMLAVDAVLGSGEKLALVAKMFPKNEYARKLFKSWLSMRKEVDMYVMVGPEFDKIQEEAHIPVPERLRVLCECPGARLTLEGSEWDQRADENSILLLENLKIKGYRTGDRHVGLDLKHAEYALKHLARFHATAVAIRLKKPLIFKTKVLRACTPFKITPKIKEERRKDVKLLLEKLWQIPICEEHKVKIEEAFMKGLEERYSEHFPEPREPFATIKHKDFWLNNMMFRYKDEDSSDPIDFKIVDFQTCMYGSPVYDIMLFIFTSTQGSIAEDNFDHLIKLYHDSYVEWLGKLKCDTQDFSFDRFLEEINIEALEFLDMLMFMLRPITLPKEESEQSNGRPDFNGLGLNELYIRRVTSIARVYAQKGWI